MRLNRCIRALAIAFCSMGMMIGVAHAQDTSATLTPLKVRLERLPLPCTPPIYRAYATAEPGKFTFLIPGGFRFRGDCETKIKLANLEGNCLITFTIIDPAPCDSQPLNADAYRDVVQARYPKGRIIEQLCPGAAGRDGVGFDTQWETTNRFPQYTRTAFVPSTLGLLEFTGSCGPKDFSTLCCQLNQVMGTFKAAPPDGKLEVPHVSASDNDRTDAGSLRRNGQHQTFFWSGSSWSST